ncbi:MAG: restriction endonuclease subunit S [Proteobacteria bacterium]|nr:restriction endonuclease subunit S [Candidatus Enterousia onthequi]
MNNVPFDWKINKLGNVADVFDGTHQTPEYVDHGIKFISAEDISDPSASTKYITHQAFENNFKIRPNKNDIFMTRIGRIGIPFLLKTDEDFAYYVTLALLKLKRDVVPEYLFYFIQSNYFQFELWKRTLHVAFPEKINKDEIGKCLVLYPDNITEQKKIAEILGTWDRAIEALTGLIAEKKELKRGLMQRLLSGTQRLPGFTKPWQNKKIGDITHIATAVSKSQYIKETGPYLIVDMGAVSNEATLIAKKQTDYEGDFLIRDDLIMPKDDIGGGNIIGKTVVIDYNNKYILGDHVFKIRVTSVECAKFISNLINSFGVNKYMRRVSTGSAQLGLAKRDVEKCVLFVPTELAEQKAIADVLSKADSEIDLLNQQLELLKEQKRGLMQKLLTGEIRVKVDAATC